MPMRIERVEREPEELQCRFCGSDSAETYYFDREGEYIGCEYCVNKKEWYETRSEDIT